jgi:hypothetical protein
MTALAMITAIVSTIVVIKITEIVSYIAINVSYEMKGKQWLSTSGLEGD